MNILFFDTETNGLKNNGVCPRITQIAWIVVESETEFVYNEKSCLVKPDGWEVPKTQFFIDNNISTERCQEHGVDMPAILDLLIQDIIQYGVEVIVAHNIAFDAPVLVAEMKMYGKTIGRKLRKLCTMLSYSNHYGGKWPKLQEMHVKLFGEEFEGAHDALDDIKATVKCFFEMQRLKIIKL